MKSNIQYENALRVDLYRYRVHLCANFKRSGSEFDIKYHSLHDFITSTPFDEKSSDHFKDLHKMEFLTNFDISLTSFLGGVMN